MIDQIIAQGNAENRIEESFFRKRASVRMCYLVNTTRALLRTEKIAMNMNVYETYIWTAGDRLNRRKTIAVIFAT